MGFPCLACWSSHSITEDIIEAVTGVLEGDDQTIIIRDSGERTKIFTLFLLASFPAKTWEVYWFDLHVYF